MRPSGDSRFEIGASSGVPFGTPDKSRRTVSLLSPADDEAPIPDRTLFPTPGKGSAPSVERGTGPALPGESRQAPARRDGTLQSVAVPALVSGARRCAAIWRGDITRWGRHVALTIDDDLARLADGVSRVGDRGGCAEDREGRPRGR
jgi:hypothetical protein